ncbi:MAG TPA: hypothetical protein VMA72_25265 [Streptosporangiaceae bacterium]|nr:hypothetical protein [Streptosporangiaceae bacterium]
MTSAGNNYGIQVSGSATVNAGAMAAGTGAQAYGSQINDAGQAADSIEELREAIAALVEQLRAAPPGVEDPAALVQIAESVQLEAGKERPNKGMISGLLGALVAGAGGAATIANAVTAIQHAVSVLF